MTSSYIMNKLRSIADFTSMTSADFDVIMGTNVKSKEQSSEQAFQCQFCENTDHLIRDPTEGKIICTKCGHITESTMYDHTPEWKTFDDSPTNGRCGMPTSSLLPQSSLGTTIGGSCNYRFKTLQRWSSMPSPERSLNTVLNIIKEKCASAGLLSCIEDDAKILYKIASEYKNSKHKRMIIRGKNKKGLMAASVFYACKRRNNTKSLKDIAKLFGIKSSCVNKGCKNFAKYVKYKNIDYGTNLSHPSQYIKQFCEKLKLNTKTAHTALETARNIEKYNLVPSHTPISIAAACILFSVHLHEEHDGKTSKCIDKVAVAEVFNISEVTLTKTYNKLLKHKDIMTKKKHLAKLLKQSTNTSNALTPAPIIEKLKQIKQLDCSKYFGQIDITLSNFVSYDLIEHMTYCNSECRKLID